MHSRMTYAIKFVADMEQAIQFYRDVLGLPLKFQSPEWSEFATGIQPWPCTRLPSRIQPGWFSLVFVWRTSKPSIGT
jgi:catechol 2,3-dioxygenase-like lactoylglutathione lyase family enzyme